MKVAFIDATIRHRLVVGSLDVSVAGVDESAAPAEPFGVALEEVTTDRVEAEAASRLARHSEGAGAVVVVTGPGSLTGVRAAAAAALGVAAVRGVPLHGVGSLEVVALAAADNVTEVVAVQAAGRGGLFVARYRIDGGDAVALEPPRRVGPDWEPGPGAPSGPELLAGPPVSAAAGADLDLAGRLRRLGARPALEGTGAARAYRRAVVAALRRPPLDLAGC